MRVAVAYAEVGALWHAQKYDRVIRIARPVYEGEYSRQEPDRITGEGRAMFAVASNPRYQNGNLRRKQRARFRAMDAPCGICRGALGPIRYDEPSDASHPLSFVIDEIRPVSRWREFGYNSPAAAAQDSRNVQAAHRCCNAAKGARIDFRPPPRPRSVVLDGEW